MTTAGIDYFFTDCYGHKSKENLQLLSWKMNGSSTPWVVKTEARNGPTAAVSWF